MSRKVALVSGSTSGIGLGVAHRLAKAGYDVIITGIADEKTIQDIIADLGSKYEGTFTFIGGNLVDRDQVEELCQSVITKYPEGIDVLINNAGINHRDPVDEYPLDKWDNMLAVNLTAPFLLTRYFLPFMKKKRWGRIVNTSSQLGLVSMPKRVAYSTTKAYLIGMTKFEQDLNSSRFVKAGPETVPFWGAFYQRTYDKSSLLRNLVEETAKAKSISFEDAKNDFFSANNPTKEPITIDQRIRKYLHERKLVDICAFGMRLLVLYAIFALTRPLA